MATKIYVNLPVKDLNKSKEFFLQLGYTFDARVSDDHAACLVISDTILIMLVTEEPFKSMITGDICDTTKSTEAIMGLSAESRDEINDIVNKAVAAGGTTPKPATDHGFMYEHGFQDLDGHLWFYFYMDTSAV
jgi:predicted lactoylglutathione lyase